MARPEKFFARASHSQRIMPLPLVAGEARLVSIDWNQILGETGTTISSSCAEADGGVVGISSPTISNGVTTLTVTANNAGAAIIEICVTMTNGEIHTRHWYAKVTDPSMSALSDYMS